MFSYGAFLFVLEKYETIRGYGLVATLPAGKHKK